jgi:hypothetical protein
VPSPLSWWFHQAPVWVHKLGVAFNHLVELVAPFGVFGPRRARLVACALIVAFQSLLIASGNLSFLNWLTLVIAFACLDDDALGRVLPDRLRHAAQQLEAVAQPSRAHAIAVSVLACVVGVLSIGPVLNMLSPHQSMNSSFDPLHLVNTYGAFGTVGRERDEIVLQGTNDANPKTATHWLDYELPCKPGAVHRRPCQITPDHYRLDWQMWFAAMSEPESEPWFVNLIYKLLRNEPTVTRLFARNPFPDRPPRFVRAQFFEYHFTRLGDHSGAYYRRKLLGNYLDPQSLHSPGLLRYLRGYGLLK